MTFKASVLHFQDEIPELEEFFLVNVTSAVLITTFATVPQLGKKATLSDLNVPLKKKRNQNPDQKELALSFLLLLYFKCSFLSPLSVLEVVYCSLPGKNPNKVTCSAALLNISLLHNSPARYIKAQRGH